MQPNISAAGQAMLHRNKHQIAFRSILVHSWGTLLNICGPLRNPLYLYTAQTFSN